MTRMSRRQFLLRGGTSLAGTLVAGALAERLLAAGAPAASRAPSSGAPGALADELATIVADLERKFPYASALVTSQTGISINRDRNGKRVSESGFPSRGVSLRVFDGAAFHESSVGSEAPDALHAAAKGLAQNCRSIESRHPGLSA